MTTADVVINEILVLNDSIPDPNGEYDSWIEFFNNSTDTLTLAGRYLSDDAANLKKWKFPWGTKIAPQGFLIVWADNNITQPGLHASFTLNSSGGKLFFSNIDQTFVDTITYGVQEHHIAIARMPNGTGTFTPIIPSFHTTNGTAITPVNMTSFTGRTDDDVVVLSWETATEMNNRGFAIERSNGSGSFREIGFVKGNGSTTETSSYSFRDVNVSEGSYFYRIKQIDFNGSYNYFPSISVDVQAPLTFSLEQNYPNPFNPVTKVRYTLGSSGYIRLIITDILGRNVTTLADMQQSKGKHELLFNAKDIPSGTYFYSLYKDGVLLSTKKMSVIK